MTAAWIALAAAGGFLAIVLYAQWRRDQRWLRDFLPTDVNHRPRRVLDLVPYDHDQDGREP